MSKFRIKRTYGGSLKNGEALDEEGIYKDDLFLTFGPMYSYLGMQSEYNQYKENPDQAEQESSFGICPVMISLIDNNVEVSDRCKVSVLVTDEPLPDNMLNGTLELIDDTIVVDFGVGTSSVKGFVPQHILKPIQEYFDQTGLVLNVGVEVIVQ